MRSFKSSEQIIHESKTLFKKLEKDYWAHINGISEKTESLYTHSQLVSDYALKLIDVHKLEALINGIICHLLDSVSFESSDAVGDYIKELFANSIFLHDLGKVNPNFQALRMKNPAFKTQKLTVEHYHSFPGAYIFCVYYFEIIFKDNTLNDKDKNLLAFIVFCLSNPIIKHHSSDINFYDRFDKSEVLKDCLPFLQIYGLPYNEDLGLNIFSYVQHFKDRFQEHADEDAFLILYILTKLSFSILTASDFYATNEYMAGLRVDEFGLVNDSLRRQIKHNFWTIKSYNVDLNKNFDYFLNKPFEKILQRNSENLNLLRQKLTAEVVSTLKKNPKNHWYYIEAPTGAGKTNLSLACVAELLESDPSINKVFYVFPFTTLITQTFDGIKDTVGLTNNELVQLHSKAGLQRKHDIIEQDAAYGHERMLYLDHLFVNYPLVVTSHVKFFEIVKGSDKETNYLFHRLCNSIVIIDEIQSYNPKHWDKMIYFIENYAQWLNIRFVIMSATLPKIDELRETIKGKFVSLIPNKDFYFSNPNFINRVAFDFSLIDELKPYKIDKEDYLLKLSEKIKEQTEEYAKNKNGKVRVIVEFITKNSASQFFHKILKEKRFSDYKAYIISADILESRRKEVIRKIKSSEDPKVILVSTQVVEAGVDIDMDIGFKNRAILDSDEQLAGRVNRNASKSGCKVFLFELDSIKTIYGKDERYKQQNLDEYIHKNWRKILIEKRFHELYKKVFAERLKPDWTDGGKFKAYLENLRRLDFRAIQDEFQLIEDNQSVSAFIPLNIEIPTDFDDRALLRDLDVLDEDEMKISGEKVFDAYIKILTRQNDDFLEKKIELKKLAGLMSLFTINLYPKVINQLQGNFDVEKENYGFKYLSHFQAYSYECGFDMSKIEEDIFL